jgi:hypothetical protein
MSGKFSGMLKLKVLPPFRNYYIEKERGKTVLRRKGMKN